MAANSSTQMVDTGDGRRLKVEVAGDADRVILAQLGTPNAGVLFDPWIRDATARGLTLVTYDRPGYGASSSQPGRLIADCVHDVRAIAAALDFQRCAVWGFSGGGPHALACGALAGDLVAAVATIGSPAPPDAVGLDYYAGMSDGVREDAAQFHADRAEWERISEGQRQAMLGLTRKELAEAWSVGKAHVDRLALSGKFGTWMYDAVRQALVPALDGALDDNVAIFYAPWGFDAAAIRVPVKIWHGRRDRFVPLAHGQWFVDHIPEAEACLNDTDGHMTVLAQRIGDVHEWLAGRLLELSPQPQTSSRSDGEIRRPRPTLTSRHG